MLIIGCGELENRNCFHFGFDRSVANVLMSMFTLAVVMIQFWIDRRIWSEIRIRILNKISYENCMKIVWKLYKNNNLIELCEEAVDARADLFEFKFRRLWRWFLQKNNYLKKGNKLNKYIKFYSGEIASICWAGIPFRIFSRYSSNSALNCSVLRWNRTASSLIRWKSFFKRKFSSI